MFKRYQLKELIGHVVRKVLTEMDAMSTSASTSTSLPSTSGAPLLSPAVQQKIEREKKKASHLKIKSDKKLLKKLENDEKSLKSTYDLTRRITKPNLKKQIDAEKKAAALGN